MTIKFYLYSRVLSNGKKMLKVRVAHKQNNVLKDTNLSTGLSIVPKFWDKDNERVVDMHPSQATINERIAEIKQRREDLLNKFDAKKLTYHQVVNQIFQKETDNSIDDFIDTKIKANKSDASYQTYQDHLRGFKKLIGHKGKLSFSDLNNEVFIDAHSVARKRQAEGIIASKSFRGYITSILTIVSEANFYGLTDLTLSIPMQYKSLDRLKDKSYHITKNRGNTTMQVMKAIQDCNSIQQWQSIALWLLAFSMRGFYYGDIASLKQKDIKDAEDKEIGHLLNTFLKDDIHVYHRRSKSAYPMYIKIFKYPVLSLIQRIKMSVVYTHSDRLLNGKSILGDINDQLSIFDYDYKNNIKWHNQMTKHFQKKLRKYELEFKKARKTFNQEAQKLSMSQNERFLLIGHKEGGKVISQSYDDNTLPQLLKRVDELHLEVLKAFKVEQIYDMLLVKLKSIIMKKKLPKWILSRGAVVREGRRLKVLTGIRNKSKEYPTWNDRMEWAYIDDEHRKYFLKDRRLAEDYWSDIEDIVNPSNTLQRVFDRLKSNQKELQQAETKVFKLKAS